MPRKYTLGKRAALQADTRRRILDAAMELYQEQGVLATTMQDIARRADVAPGTVANHFGSASALATEVTVNILAELEMPTPDIFVGVDRLSDRIRLLVRELAAFFERSEPWWYVSRREPADAEFWADAERRYYADLDALVRTALGPLADDADAAAVVGSVLGTWVIGAIQRTGRSAAEAAELTADLLTAWLATRSSEDPSTEDGAD